MAKDKNNDPNKKRMKNTELLSDKKESVSDILQRGSKGNPSQTDWSKKLPSGTGRGDIRKPNLYYEAMQEYEQNNSKEESKLTEKEKVETSKPINNEPEPDRDK